MLRNITKYSHLVREIIPLKNDSDPIVVTFDIAYSQLVELVSTISYIILSIDVSSKRKFYALEMDDPIMVLYRARLHPDKGFLFDTFLHDKRTTRHGTVWNGRCSLNNLNVRIIAFKPITVHGTVRNGQRSLNNLNVRIIAFESITVHDTARCGKDDVL